MKTYDYTITRNEISDHAICGTLSRNGIRVCNTLEHTVCCLRAGTYHVSIYKCPFSKTKILKLNTPIMDESDNLEKAIWEEEEIERLQDWQQKVEAGEINPEEQPYAEQPFLLERCEQCLIHCQTRHRYFKRIVNKIDAAIEDGASVEELDILEERQQQKLQQSLADLSKNCPLPACAHIGHGTGIKGMPGGTILLGEFPEKIVLGDKAITLPILKNSKDAFNRFLKRVESAIERGDEVYLTIRG